MNNIKLNDIKTHILFEDDYIEPFCSLYSQDNLNHCVKTNLLLPEELMIPKAEAADILYLLYRHAWVGNAGFIGIDDGKGNSIARIMTIPEISTMSCTLIKRIMDFIESLTLTELYLDECCIINRDDIPVEDLIKNKLKFENQLNAYETNESVNERIKKILQQELDRREKLINNTTQTQLKKELVSNN